jgi:hypothetical protein
MPSTNSVCGDFEDATFPDLGQCRPRRLKKDCRHHVVPIEQVISSGQISGCEDENLTTEYFPELTPPIRIIATIFDPECEPLLDTDDEPITGPTV